jgi:hypothetical protein
MTKLTEDDVRNCTWTLDQVTPDYRRYVGRGTHPVTGVEIVVQKTEYLAENALMARNADERNETDNRRWTQGSGSDRNGVPLVKVASIPLNKFYADFASRLKEGDKDFGRWWLQKDENQPFRTRRGKV